MQFSVNFCRRADRNSARGTAEDGLLKVCRDTAGTSASGGCNICAPKPGDDVGGPFGIDNFLKIVSTANITRLLSETHHFFAKKVKSLESTHCLCTSLDILKDNVCLTSHFLGLHSHDVENGTVSGKQGVK